ncbi:MAG: hypothetical protein U1A04_11635 [Moraxellaceae bacterium]|nr:hypothetical protein [Moraxellaceae bacterium]
MNIKSILLTTVLAFATLGMTACDESRGNDFQGAAGQDGQEGQDGQDGEDGDDFDRDVFCAANPDNIICTDDIDEFCAIDANKDKFVCDDDIQEFCGREENAERPICVGIPGEDGADFDIVKFCADNPANPICDDRDAFCAENPNNVICQEVEEPETGGLIFNVQETTAGLLNGTPLEVLNDGLNTLVDPQDGVLSPLTGALESASDDGGPLAPVRDGVNTLLVQPDSLRVVIDALNQILKVLDPSALGGGVPGLPDAGGGAPALPGLDALPIDQACAIPFLGPLLVQGAGGSCE